MCLKEFFRLASGVWMNASTMVCRHVSLVVCVCVCFFNSDILSFLPVRKVTSCFYLLIPHQTHLCPSMLHMLWGIVYMLRAMPRPEPDTTLTMLSELQWLIYVFISCCCRWAAKMYIWLFCQHVVQQSCHSMSGCVWCVCVCVCVCDVCVMCHNGYRN